MYGNYEHTVIMPSFAIAVHGRGAAQVHAGQGGRQHLHHECQFAIDVGGPERIRGYGSSLYGRVQYKLVILKAPRYVLMQI